ncbi:NAD(P)/FAD-dependent oxidoreductase [Thiohalorhabdus methylotrophus]|uniref:NAD(P)/FAD-dependent oxidoreductase n=1 Tax=Thiohalorhabdus methylotrophus TaxID=3242694 RepID=A0ABV4TUJ3_9GAMM
MNAAPLRIAVVGSGISGLVAAHRLGPHHAVSLFEADSRPGGHTHTVTVSDEDGIHGVDTGFIVFNPVNYPRFCALLSELGIPARDSDMSFSVHCEATGIEWCGSGSLNRIFGQRRNLLRPAFYRMLADIRRFGREARTVLSNPTDGRTVAELLADGGYGPDFVRHYLLPLGAALWSCPEGRFAEFPIRFVAEFLDNHAMLDPLGGRPVWRTIPGGSHRYVSAILHRFPGALRLATPVRRVERDEQGVTVCTDTGGRERFDEVILACHADQALRLLDRPTAVEAELLGAFPYTVNDAVLHTDTSVLPRRRRTWAAWNVHRRTVRDEEVAITYNMNILQRLPSRSVYCVTLNDVDGIDPGRVIRRMSYAHPRFTANRRHAQDRHGEVIRRHRTSYCGAYWGYGFHEDGVRSAEAVADAFGVAS